jgi:hypothetical protein
VKEKREPSDNKFEKEINSYICKKKEVRRRNKKKKKQNEKDS